MNWMKNNKKISPPTNNSLIIPNWLHLPKILLKIFPNGAHKQ